jgi:hypothetical protein
MRRNRTRERKLPKQVKKTKSKFNSKYVSLIIPLIGVILASGLVTAAFNTVWSAFYVTSSFSITIPADLSYVEIRNDGHAAAHNVRITTRTQGDQVSSSSVFSSENCTSTTSYDTKTDSTLIVVQLKRMARQASLSLTLNAYSGKSIEAWVSSDENGAYSMAVRNSQTALVTQIANWINNPLVLEFALAFIGTIVAFSIAGFWKRFSQR